MKQPKEAAIASSSSFLMSPSSIQTDSLVTYLQMVTSFSISLPKSYAGHWMCPVTFTYYR